MLAVTLSIVVLLTYQVILTKVNPPPLPGAVRIQEPPVRPAEQKEAVPAEAVKTILPDSAVIRTVQGERYKIDIADIGGSISRITIKDPLGHDLNLVDNAAYEAGVLSMKGSGALSNLSSENFSPGSASGTMSFQNSDFRVEKNIAFLKDTQGMKASLKITNVSGAGKAVSFDIVAASNISKKEVYEQKLIEINICFKDGKIKRLTGANLLKYNRLYAEGIEWIALKNKYYAIVAKPGFTPKGVFTKGVAGEPVIGFIVEDDNVSHGETRTYNIDFYVGPMEIKELEKVDQGFTKVLNFGFLTSISLVLLSILKFFNAIFHNYGVAILLLTLFVSLFLYPLTFKSLKSMQKLQELQPHMEKIRSEHKDNPAKVNKEIMELYRRYKVNPMGGCLPMFLQMPVFIALYNTLSRSVELKGAGFLWIKDLSMPDAFIPLKFSLPVIGSAINLLPILMIGAMILQQKMSQIKAAGQTEQQKMMAVLMPLIFGFIFYSLPSGLVLYWLTNTLITSGLQFMMSKKSA